MPPIEYKILILENSNFLKKGLYRILIESGINCSIFFAADIDEMKNLLKYKEIDLVISNLNFFINDSQILKNIKHNNPDTIFTGLQYSYIDLNLINEFSYIFQINDSQDVFLNKINELIQQDYSDDRQNINLSIREIEVLKLLVEGFSNKEIADKLNLSIHTVNTHRKNISQKTGIKSLAALIIFAVSKNYIHIDSLDL